MKPLEQILSPVVHRHNENDVALIEEIAKQKMDILSQRINSTQTGLVRPEINESWIRSQKYGLHLFDFNYGPFLDQIAFQELVREKDLLLKAADPYLSQLEAILSAGCSVLLSDERGVMLRVVIGNNELLVKSHIRSNLEPGVIWSEKTIGTCAHGISMITGDPMQICGPEHYNEGYENISCSAAPIFDPCQNLAGTLSIVTPSIYHQNRYLLSLAVSVALAIQNSFQLLLNNELLNAALEAADDPVITINNSGIITTANGSAIRMLSYLGKDLRGMHIDNVLGKQALIKSVLDTGKPVLNTEIKTENMNQRLNLHSAQPVKDLYGNNFGCVLTLKKIDRVKKMENPIRSLETRFTFDKIVGNSSKMEKCINIAKKIARLEANVLIEGESGTGKEMFAQAIHNESRPDGPFIAINCAAIPKTLIESEFFGYQGGAFTGAERQGRSGKVELANGGTLFLDEIGDMPLELQPVLLRALEEKKIMRVGGSRYLPVDFRLITATNKNLSELVKSGQFRQDLYYRLEGFKISIPPLRERGSDIVRLAKYYIDNIAEKQQMPAPALSDMAISCLFHYSWPGNVRQLENAMFYAVNMSNDGIINLEDLPTQIGAPAIALSYIQVDSEFEINLENRITQNNLSIKKAEAMTIIQALIKTESNISEAANMLGMSRSTLYRKIKEYDLLGELRKNKLRKPKK